LSFSNVLLFLMLSQLMASLAIKLAKQQKEVNNNFNIFPLKILILLFSIKFELIFKFEIFNLIKI
ncbi:hypothetical protein EIC17_08760, partial [Campylobacter jejuni]|nr:hypothetical protein [Campylobacter jejuni]